MKYKYYLFQRDFTIQELYYDHKKEIGRTHTFTVNNLKDHLYEDMITRNANFQKIKSYYRTRQWLLKNHPELMI